MRLLATNDDGIGCTGILELAGALERAGHEVVIAAPDRERSGSSHGLSLAAGILFKEARKNHWMCGGMPADCVVGAFCGGFIEKPAAVVSGINAGSNLGTDLVYSGTAAGARQASLLGLPGIAFSLTGGAPFDFSGAAAWAASHFEQMLALWSEDVFINVNFPPEVTAAAPFELCVPAHRRYIDYLTDTPAEDGWRQLVFSDVEIHSEALPGTDCAVVAAGRVAVSRILVQPMAAAR